MGSLLFGKAPMAREAPHPGPWGLEILSDNAGSCGPDLHLHQVRGSPKYPNILLPAWPTTVSRGASDRRDRQPRQFASASWRRGFASLVACRAEPLPMVWVKLWVRRKLPTCRNAKAPQHGAFSDMYGGSAEIRTLGRLPVGGFQDRCLKPLGHTSEKKPRRPARAAIVPDRNTLSNTAGSSATGFCYDPAISNAFLDRRASCKNVTTH